MTDNQPEQVHIHDPKGGIDPEAVRVLFPRRFRFNALYRNPAPLPPEPKPRGQVRSKGAKGRRKRDKAASASRKANR